MNSNEFALWLKGFADGVGAKGPTRDQWDKIQNQLKKCFDKVTPNRNLNEELKKKLSDLNRNVVSQDNSPVACGINQSVSPLRGTTLYC